MVIIAVVTSSCEHASPWELADVEHSFKVNLSDIAGTTASKLCRCVKLEAIWWPESLAQRGKHGVNRIEFFSLHDSLMKTMEFNR